MLPAAAPPAAASFALPWSARVARWLRARSEEFPTTWLWPATPRLFARHASFQRLSLTIFLFNVVIMWATLQLTHLLITELDPGQRYSSRAQYVGWAEGLLRYTLWTALNFPLAMRFRRMWYADLTMAGRLPGVGPAVLFGRQIFWASLVATFLFQWAPGDLNPGAIVAGTTSTLAAWMRGDHVFRSIGEPLFEGFEVLHNAAVSLFRAAAVSYALLAGGRVRDAILRVVLVYSLGGVLLFSTHRHGMELGISNADRAYAERHQAIDRARARNNLHSRHLETLALWARRTLDAPPLFDRAIRTWAERVRHHREVALQRQRIMLQVYRNEWRFLYVRSYLFPYYFVCVGGATILLVAAARRHPDGD